MTCLDIICVSLFLYVLYTGQSRLREIFLKTDNVISGSYLAEITKEVKHTLSVSLHWLFAVVVPWANSTYCVLFTTVFLLI